VAIDVHGSLDRAKDVSSFGQALIGRCSKSAGALRTLTTFPSSFFQRTPVVAGAFACLGRAPCKRDGPAKTHTAPPAREG